MTGFLDAVARQARLAEDAAERPWPLPTGPWAQAQTLLDAVTAHWPVPLVELARHVPPELALDTFDGEAWVGLVAARVAGRRVRGVPPLPGLSGGLQIELRTYVVHGDRPGIWPLALECGSRPLVELAKRTHLLPAQRAELTSSGGSSARGAAGRYDARRGGLGLRFAWSASGPALLLEPGSFEEFATGRFAVYTADGGRLHRAELHQAPSPLRSAHVELEDGTLSPVELGGAPAAAWTTERQDVLVWPLEEL